MSTDNKEMKIDHNAIKAGDKYKEICQMPSDKKDWSLKMFNSVNTFLWHLETFNKGEVPLSLCV